MTRELEKARLVAERLLDGSGAEEAQILGRSGRRLLQKRVKERSLQEDLRRAEISPGSPEAILLTTGWDCSDDRSRREARKALDLGRPQLLVARLGQETPTELEFALEMCSLQESRGKHFVLEIPESKIFYAAHPSVIRFEQKRKVAESADWFHRNGETGIRWHNLPPNQKGLLEDDDLLADFAVTQAFASIGEEDILEVFAAGIPVEGEKVEKTDAEIKTSLEKLHRNLGHPARSDMVRVLVHAKASARALALAREWKCAVCDEEKGPKLALPARPKKAVANFESIGIDVKWIPGRTPSDPRRQVLNVLDEFSSLQQFILLKGNETAENVWEAFDRGWRTPYGKASIVRADAAKNLVLGTMKQKLDEDGSRVEQAAGEASWQMGKTERHGGWLAAIVARVLRDARPQNEEE